MSSNESQVTHCHDFSESFPLFKQHTAGAPPGGPLSISQDVHSLAHHTRETRERWRRRQNHATPKLLPSSLALSLATWGYLWPSLHPRLHCKPGRPNTVLRTDLVCFLNSSTLVLLPGTSHHCLRHFGVAPDGGPSVNRAPRPAGCSAEDSILAPAPREISAVSKANQYCVA